MASSGIQSFGIPNPFSWVGDVFGGGASDILGSLFNGLGGIIQGWIASAVSDAVNALISLVNNSAGLISFSSHSWWGTKVAGSGQLWGTVLSIALAVLLGCLILAVIQGAFAGDPMMALRAAAVEVPRSIFGMVTVVALTGLLSGVVDSASTAVLPSVGSDFGSWFSKADPVGFFGCFVECLVLLGALLTWVELVVRQALVFLLVALSPMVLAVRVWPAAAGVWRRLVELAVALIVSKFAIALALALGADALAASTKGGASLTAMTTGAGLMLLASLSPFVLLRMLPGIEGAVAAQGISRMPIRTAQSAVSTATSVMLLGRLGAGGAGGKAITGAPATGGSSGSGDGGDPTVPIPVVSTSLARTAALNVGSRPALNEGGDRGLPPGPKGLPPGPKALPAGPDGPRGGEGS